MRRKLITILILFSAIPLLISSLFSLYFYSQNMQAEFQNLSTSKSEVLRTEVASFINKHLELLRLLSKHSAIRALDIPNSFPIIENASKTYPDLIPISIDNDKGKQLVKSDRSTLVDVTDRAFYKQAMQGKEDVVSEVVISKANNQPIVILATPLRSESGTIIGVLQGTINLGVLTNFVKERSKDGSVAYILDLDGKVIAHPDAKLTSERADMSKLPFVQKARKGEAGIEDILDDSGNKRLINYGLDKKTGWIVCFEQSYDTYYANRSKLIYTSGFVLVVSLFLVITIGILASKRATRPIEQLVAATESIGKGDLTIKVEVRQNDEIGRLGSNFNQMVANLQLLVRKVAGSSEQVAASAQQLTASADQSAMAISQIANAITQVSQGAEVQAKATNEADGVVNRLAASIRQTADNSASVAAISKKTAQAAARGETEIGKAIEQMSELQKTVSQSAQVVVDLGQRSQEIGQIIDTIANIAGQTNLLALNAAIEAARAGEQGRGFAVVAEEVRKLAEQSHDAAKQIAELIGSIQQETTGAVRAMTNGTEEVKKGTEMVNLAGTSFAEIAALIQQVSDQVAGISTAVTTMTADSEQMVSSVHRIDSISKEAAAQSQTVSASTEETTASMEEIADASQALVRTAEELQTMIRQFRL